MDKEEKRGDGERDKQGRREELPTATHIQKEQRPLAQNVQCKQSPENGWDGGWLGVE